MSGIDRRNSCGTLLTLINTEVLLLFLLEIIFVSFFNFFPSLPHPLPVSLFFAGVTMYPMFPGTKKRLRLWCLPHPLTPPTKRCVAMPVFVWVGPYCVCAGIHSNSTKQLGERGRVYTSNDLANEEAADWCRVTG